MALKYKEVYDSEKDKIINKKYKANEKIPTGQILAKEYECSLLTVKKALDILVADGLLVRKRGLGTFVKKNLEIDRNARKNKGKTGVNIAERSLIREGYSSIVEEFEITKCDKELAKNLNIKVGDFVYYIVRVRLYKDEPKVIEYTWMPINLIKGLGIKQLKGSIYYYIVEELKLKIQSSHINIGAQDANELEQKYFNMKPEDIVIEVVQTAFLDNAEIFEYSIAHHVPKSFNFETNVIREFNK